ncbi:Ig-like domain-containing protein [Methanoculleus frigidifontis]|nr:Ig-like domain-containing protein [Methanoculleus sp. FWC-SCC1]
MKYWIFGCLLLGVVMLTSPAGAQVPDQVGITGSTAWLVAGGDGSAEITATVQNGSTPLAGLDVAFSVDAAYGSITPATGVTDANGRATATFTPGTLSGDAPITVRVTYPGGEIVRDYLQQIDHAAPYALAGLSYASEATVGEETDIVVRLADRYGNPVDGRNAAESVVFGVSSAGGTAGFVNGEAYETPVAVAVDAAGDATGTLRVCERAGENFIVIDSPGPIPDTYISILGVANGTPASIISVVSPSTGSPPSVPADGTSNFSFTYTLYDRYGNPTEGQQLRITTMGGEDAVLTTSSSGQVAITYGPKDTTGTVTITATAAANASVSVSQEVAFTSTDPVNMLLTASPQTMPSRDARPDSVALVRAKVMDIKGNPVSGEVVEFAIANIACGTSVLVEDPYFTSPSKQTASAQTDEDGYATVRFYPGSFITDRDNPAWNGTATGTCTVRAEWGNISRMLAVSWKNYPYLSVETFVEPETVAVNGTIDTTIRLRGDGWALQPDPIDVVLVIDRSGSMDGTDLYPSRMAAAKNAANEFIGRMNLDTRDRVALVSFAFDARLDQGLVDDAGVIQSAVNALHANGATNMRQAYYEAIKYLKGNGRPEAVKAVILMSDGNWNYHGSPLAAGTGYPDSDTYLSTRYPSYPDAILSGYPWSGSSYSFSSEKYEWYSDLPDPKGTLNRWLKWYRYDPVNGDRWGKVCDDGQFTNQNMSVYATSGDAAENVRIYSIGFASNLDDNVERDLTVLSEATGGKYVWAGNEDELRQVYTDIAGELKTEAGVNTQMSVCFENVEVNGTPKNGADVFDYVYAEGSSTRIYSFNNTVDIIPEYTRDDTSAWQNDHTLTFNVGTVRLNQTWETTFRLKVLVDGNINVFGSGSTITFNDGTDTLDLPDLFVTAIPDLNNTGVGTGSLDIANLRCTGSGPYLDFLPLAWDLTYTGVDEVTEEIYCQNDGVSWIYAASKTPEVAGGTTVTENYLLDVRNLPPGEYSIRVKATAPDAPADQETLDVADWVGRGERPYIRIQ